MWRIRELGGHGGWRTQYYFGFFALFGEYIFAVKVAVDELDFGVLKGYGCAFVAVADKARDFVLWVGVGDAGEMSVVRI